MASTVYRTTAEFRHLSARHARLARADPGDPRLPALKRELRLLTASRIAAWADAVVASEAADEVEYRRLLDAAHHARRRT